jgi:hypothetical protein
METKLGLRRSSRTRRTIQIKQKFRRWETLRAEMELSPQLSHSTPSKSNAYKCPISLSLSLSLSLCLTQKPTLTQNLYPNFHNLSAISQMHHGRQWSESSSNRLPPLFYPSWKNPERILQEYQTSKNPKPKPSALLLREISWCVFGRHLRCRVRTKNGLEWGPLEAKCRTQILRTASFVWGPYRGA